MPETQATISAWADATFGTASSNARVAARANEEMAELLRAITSDDPAKLAKVPEEAADVVIVLCRLATRLGYKLPPLTVELEASQHHVTLHWAAWANKWLARAIQSLTETEGISANVPDCLLGCVLNLAQLCKLLGTDLWTEVERKMAVNRGRTWRWALDGSGHGYHVREKGTA